MPRVLSDAMVSSSPDTHLTLATTPVQAAGRVVRLASAGGALGRLRLASSPISAALRSQIVFAAVTAALGGWHAVLVWEVSDERCGLTETYGPITVCPEQEAWRALPVEQRAKYLARQGQAYPSADLVRVVDAQLADVPRDGTTMGEVVMRGNIELRDRGKDIIISGGENISSIEVEQAIAAHPVVLECAVVGIPHPRWGERPKAFVTLNQGAAATPQEIIAFCRERLAHYRCPDAIAFGPLPKTSTGKIQKFILRDREWKGQDKRISGG